MKRLLDLLQEIRPDVDFESEQKLIDSKVLDSFDIVSIVSSINEEFDVDIDIDDLIPENFNSVKAMMSLIEKMRAGD